MKPNSDYLLELIVQVAAERSQLRNLSLFFFYTSQKFTRFIICLHSHPSELNKKIRVGLESITKRLSHERSCVQRSESPLPPSFVWLAHILMSHTRLENA